LKTGAAGTAALPALAVARNVHVSGVEQVRIGMIGCGGRCTGAAAQSMKAGPFVKLVAMCDIFEDRLERSRRQLKERYPDQVLVDDDHCFVGFDGYRKVIESADAVLIACASKFHPMYCEAAIKAGKHVFVEKPHAIDPVGLRRMERVCELAKQKGLSVVSGLQSRFHKGWQETIKRIHDGAIGEIVAIQAMFLRGPYRLVERDPKLTETQYQFSNWYHFRWLSGDDVPQSLVHNMDRAEWVLQEQTPKWAFGIAGRSTNFAEVYGDVFDHHTVVYEYPNGARVYAMCRTIVGCYNNSGDIIMGTKGVCYLARCQIEGETNWRFKGKHNNPYDAEQKALIDSIIEGKPINSGYHMCRSTMVTILGQMSCYTGKALQWDEIYSAKLQLGPPPEQSTFETPPPVLPDEKGTYPVPIPGITKLSELYPEPKK
jgi:predicted dehydrogenase